MPSDRRDDLYSDWYTRKSYTYGNNPAVHYDARSSNGEVLYENTDPFTNSSLAVDGNLEPSSRHSKPYAYLPASENHELSSLPQRPGNPFEHGDLNTRSDFPTDDYRFYPNSAIPDGSSQNVLNAGAAKTQDRLHIHEKNRRLLQDGLPRYHMSKLPYFTIVVTTAQIIVFIVELARMGILTGKVFQTEPYFNPMLGPSTYVLINLGARYVPCMHVIDGITLDLSLQFPCPNSTTTATNVCNLNQLCGISGIPIVDGAYIPSQYYRIVLPIFLHAGFLHIIFNLLLQLVMGIAVERSIGWLKYAIIYVCSGVLGFLLGANFSPIGIASTGALGSLFGIIATNLLLFVYCGRKNTNIYATKHYKSFIIMMIGEIIVSFVLGLLPGLDNFSHIGGFCVGALLSLVLLRDPSFVYIEGVYTYETGVTAWQTFLNNWNPLYEYAEKIPKRFAIWMAVRVVSLILFILYFALLVTNLKSKSSELNTLGCSWCKYINCIPVNGWCEIGEVTVSTVDSGSTATATTSGSTATFNPEKRDFENVSELFGIHTESHYPSIQATNTNNDPQGVMIAVVMAFMVFMTLKKTQFWKLGKS